MGHLPSYPRRMLTSRQHHRGVCVTGLIWAAVPHTSLFHSWHPHVFRIGPSHVQHSSVRGFWKASASAKNVCAFCAFTASSARRSSFTLRRHSSVFVVSAYLSGAKPIPAAQFGHAQRAADQVMSGWVLDPTGGATHYYATTTKAPAWAAKVK